MLVLYTLQVSKYIAKIGADNAPSLALFRKLGFRETKFVEIFNERHFELAGSEVAGVDKLERITLAEINH